MMTVFTVIGMVSVTLFLIVLAAALIVWPEFTSRKGGTR